MFDFEKLSLLDMAADNNDSNLIFFNPKNSDIYVKMTTLVFFMNNIKEKEF